MNDPAEVFDVARDRALENEGVENADVDSRMLVFVDVEFRLPGNISGFIDAAVPGLDPEL